MQLESLKNIINENKTRMPNAKATEIVQKSIPKLHLKSTVEVEGPDSWKFTASILKPDVLKNEVMLRDFEGRGSSKKMAKTGAFGNLIANILSFETD